MLLGSCSLGDTWHIFLRAITPSFHPTNIAKALEGTQITVPNSVRALFFVFHLPPDFWWKGSSFLCSELSDTGARLVAIVRLIVIQQ